MATLRLYEGGPEGEYIVICTELSDTEELTEGDTLVYEVALKGDFKAWPTDRMLIQA